MKTIVVIAAALAVFVAADSVYAFMHDKVLEQLKEGANQLEKELQKGQQQPEEKITPSAPPKMPDSFASPKSKSSSEEPSSPLPAATQAVRSGPPAPEHECDKFAGHKDDKSKVGPGISMKNLNAEKAISSCTLAVSNFPNEPRFNFQLGRSYFKKKDFKKANKWYRTSANQGHAYSSFMLGYVHLIGNRGVSKNTKTAAKWFNIAAEKGLPVAQYYLGDLYEFGDGVSKNLKTAIKLYRLAADQGHARAKRHLGEMYDKNRDPSLLTPKQRADKYYVLDRWILTTFHNRTVAIVEYKMIGGSKAGINQMMAESALPLSYLAKRMPQHKDWTVDDIIIELKNEFPSAKHNDDETRFWYPFFKNTKMNGSAFDKRLSLIYETKMGKCHEDIKKMRPSKRPKFNKPEDKQIYCRNLVLERKY